MKVFFNKEARIFKIEVAVLSDVLISLHIRKDILFQFFKTLLKANLCCGNTHFPNLITSKLKKRIELDFLNKGRNLKATIQSKTYQIVKELNVIRATSCMLVVKTKIDVTTTVSTVSS